jgi:two-component SAPR family response regulator
MEGFRLYALDYIVKPLSPQRVDEAVRRIGAKCQAGSQWP